MVLPTREWRGLNDLANPEGARPVVVLPCEEAFSRRWETDAHFAGYLVDPYDPSEPFYRINKPALRQVRLARYELLLHHAALDWDTGKGVQHVPWTRESWHRFQAVLERARAFEGWRRLDESALARYATSKGFRWVFRLDPPPPVDLGERVVAGLVDSFWAAGVEVDRSCADWTRLYRLPLVRRED